MIFFYITTLKSPSCFSVKAAAGKKKLYNQRQESTEKYHISLKEKYPVSEVIETFFQNVIYDVNLKG